MPLASKGITSPRLFRRLSNQKPMLSTTEGRTTIYNRANSQIGVLGELEEVKNYLLTQKLVFLGAFIDLEKGMIFPTLPSLERLDLSYTNIRKDPSQKFLRLLGIMNSCIDLVPWAKLHMRPLQMHLLYYWKVMEKNIYLKIPVTDHVKSHLH